MKGAEMSRKKLFDELAEYVEGDFIPLNYSRHGTNVTFFIESDEVRLPFRGAWAQRETVADCRSDTRDEKSHERLARQSDLDICHSEECAVCAAV